MTGSVVVCAGPACVLGMLSTDSITEQWAVACDERFTALQDSRADLGTHLIVVAQLMADAITGGSKVILCGNGGSAADAQHVVAEFVGRFERERAAWASVALSENVSSMTGIGNDYAYDRIFARQLEALGQPGDVLVGLSTSGGSANVVNALAAAGDQGITSIAITGRSGGRCAQVCDHWVPMPSTSTAVIQESYLQFLHSAVRAVEQGLAG